MDSEEAREKLIYFVEGHQGCIAQDVVDGVADVMSRTLAFRYLKQLINEGIIEDRKLNRRDHRFFVNSTNPLVLVARELDELEARFTLWMNKVREKFYNQMSLAERTNRQEDFNQADDIWRGAYFSVNGVSSHIFNTYTTRALSEWSKFSTDREYLDKLYSTLFSKLHHIMSNLLGAFSTVVPAGVHYRILHYKMDLSTFRGIKEYSHTYQLDNREFDDLMTTIWKISENVYECPGDDKRVGWKEVFENTDMYPE